MSDGPFGQFTKAKLADLESLHSGAADRVLKSYEDDRAADRLRADRELTARIDQERWGLRFGFTLGVLALFVGGAVAIWASPFAGAAIGSANGVATVVSAFVVRRKT